MIKRICNRCGKVYVADNGGHCNCKASVRAAAERRKRYDSGKRLERGGDFYHSPMWIHLANSVRERDSDTDRLQFHLYILAQRGLLKGYYPAKFLTPRTKDTERAVAFVLQRLSAVLLDRNGYPRLVNIPGDLTVHHIIPRTDDDTEQWNAQNLITLFPTTHTEVHVLYSGTQLVKLATQALLRDALTNGDGLYQSMHRVDISPITGKKLTDS